MGSPRSPPLPRARRVRSTMPPRRAGDAGIRRFFPAVAQPPDEAAAPDSMPAPPPRPAPPAVARTYARKRSGADSSSKWGEKMAVKRPASRRPSPGRLKKPPTQTHLDLGQARFHATACPECGMVYAPGDARDESLHAAHHAAATRAPRLAPGAGVKVSDAAGGRVVHFGPAAATGKRWPAAVTQLLSQAEADLGAAPGWLAASPAAHALVFECGMTKRCAGLALVECLASGTRVARAAAGEATTASASAAAAPPPPKPRAALGARAVWVAPSHRRRGVASALLDAGRLAASPLASIPRAALAFSAPTDAGAALAGAYGGAGGYVTYQG